MKEKTLKLNKVQLENKERCEKYPFLIPCYWTGKPVTKRADWNYEYTWRDDVSIGWLHLFDLMCEELLAAIEGTNCFKTFKFEEVKSKYGELRIYEDGGNKKTAEIIRKWCFLSGYVCETCGKPDVRITNGYIAPICFECWNRFYSLDRGDYIENTNSVLYPPVLKVIKYTPSGNNKLSINYEKDFKRLVDDWSEEFVRKYEEENV